MWLSPNKNVDTKSKRGKGQRWHRLFACTEGAGTALSRGCGLQRHRNHLWTPHSMNHHCLAAKRKFACFWHREEANLNMHGWKCEKSEFGATRKKGMWWSANLAFPTSTSWCLKWDATTEGMKSAAARCSNNAPRFYHHTNTLGPNHTPPELGAWCNIPTPVTTSQPDHATAPRALADAELLRGLHDLTIFPNLKNQKRWKYAQSHGRLLGEST